MRRALLVGVVALAGVGLAVWLLGGDAPPVPVAQAPVEEQAQPPVEADAEADAEPDGEGFEAEAEALPVQEDPDVPADPGACELCYLGVNLTEARDAGQITRVHEWSDADYTAAVEALWARYDRGELEFAPARRADQALLVDRLLGTDIDAATRTALLDLHSETQQALAAAPKTPRSAPGVTTAMGSYEEGAAALLTEEQLDRLLNGRPVGH